MQELTQVDRIPIDAPPKRVLQGCHMYSWLQAQQNEIGPYESGTDKQAQVILLISVNT